MLFKISNYELVLVIGEDFEYDQIDILRGFGVKVMLYADFDYQNP